MLTRFQSIKSHCDRSSFIFHHHPLSSSTIFLVKSTSSTSSSGRHRPLTPSLIPSRPTARLSSSISHPPPPPPQRPSPPITSILISSLLILSLGYSIGSCYPPSDPTTKYIIQSLKPNLLPSSSSQPAHRDGDVYHRSQEEQEIVDRLEGDLNRLPVVLDLRARPETWSSFRPFQDLDRRHLVHNLTHGTLRGPGRFAIPPLVFVNKQRTQAIAIVHVGDSMCGHDGIVHGGILATICDEGLATLAFCNLPSNVGVTASLKLNYKRPVTADQFIILRSWIPSDRTPVGRKAWSDGQIENLSGDVLVQAESLFIEPKAAKFMNRSKVREYLKLPS